jgi:Protein of unknown function (DUF 659)/hAT family C-terminal dimerisation region
MSSNDENSSMELAQSITDGAVTSSWRVGAGSPPKTGRPRDSIWNNFKRSDNHKPHATGECKHCGKLVRNGKPNENLLVHLVHHCRSVPRPIRQNLIRLRGYQRALVTYSGPSVHGNRPQSLPQRRGEQVPESTTFNVNQYSTEPNTNRIVDQDEFQLELARVFILCALPFALVESPVFQRFFHRLVPQFQLPTRKSIAGDRLDTIYMECQELVKERIRQQGIVSIVFDFWSNVKKSGILNIVAVAPGMPSLLWCSTATGTASHDAAYTTKQCEDALDEIQAETSAFVVSIQSDNASAMLASMRNIERSRPIFAAGCAAHVVNLLLQDVCKIPLVNEVKTKAVAITVYVLGHQALLDYFRRLQHELPQQHALVTPVPTRWYSVHCCLRSILSNKTLLKRLFNPPQPFRNADAEDTGATGRELMQRVSKTPKQRAKLAQFRAIVMDWSFWHHLRHIVEMMDPIIHSLRVLESDNTYASQVYEEFRLLLANDVYCASDTPNTVSTNVDANNDVAYDTALVSSDDDASDIEQSDQDDAQGGPRPRALQRDPDSALSLEARFYKAIDRRWKFVHTDAMGIVFFLDPSMDLAGFVGNDQELSIQQACAYAKRSGMLEMLNVGVDEYLAALYSFARFKRTKIDRDARRLLRKTSPLDWWSAQTHTSNKLLCDLAERVFSIPTSSAACERSFSIQDFIHRKKRNRLSSDKAAKLTYCYINFATMWKDPLDMALIASYPGASGIEDADPSPSQSSVEPTGMSYASQ